MPAELVPARRSRDSHHRGELPDTDQAPILLAVSDNGAPMTADATKAFMALCSIAPTHPPTRHPSRASSATSKQNGPTLRAISDPQTLNAELERARIDYNTLRLYAGIGYVTPNDEHQNKGDTIRQARRDGLRRADHARRAARQPPTPQIPTMRTETPTIRRAKSETRQEVEGRGWFWAGRSRVGVGTWSC